MPVIIPAGIAALSGLAARLGGRAAIKRGAAYFAKKKAQAQKSKLGQTVIDKTKQARAEGIGRFKKGKDYVTGAKLSGRQTTVPVKSGFFRQTGRGARDALYLSGVPYAGYEGLRGVAPLFTDEDMTMRDAANIIGAGLSAIPAARFGRLALARQFGKGTKMKTRYKRNKKGDFIKDKQGKKIPMRDEFNRVIKDKYQIQASPRQSRQDISAAVASAPFFYYGSGESPVPPAEYSDVEAKLAPGESEIRKEFLDLTKGARGPQETALVKDIVKNLDRYSPQQITDMVNEARAADEATKETVKPDDVEQDKAPTDPPPPSDTPPAVEGTEEGAEPTQQDQAAVEQNTPATTNNIDINTNSEDAISYADKTAKTQLVSPEQMQPKNLYIDAVDVGGVLLKAEKMERDYTGMQKAMKQYSDFIKGEKDKVLTYDQYIKRFKDMTGDDDQAGNIALFKWAMAMMTGRSNQSGLAGFMDIAGNAGLAISDDLMAINERNRAENQALASAFLAYEQDSQKYLSGLRQQELGQILALEEKIMNDQVTDANDLFTKRTQIAQLRLQKMEILQDAEDARLASMGADKIETGVVVDPNMAHGYDSVQVGINKQGQPMKLVFDEVTGQPKYEFLTKEEYSKLTIIKPNPTESGKLYNRLEAINTGLKYAQTVLTVDPKALGSLGAWDGFLTNVQDVYNDWMGSQGVGVGGNFTQVEGDTAITDMLAVGAQAGIDAVTGEPQDSADDAEAFAELNQKFNKDMAKAKREFQNIIDEGVKSKVLNKETRGFLRSIKNPQERKAIILKLAQLRLIENRMKYIVANANKGEDRLTVKDVEEAEKSTRIFAFGTSSNKVVADYTALSNQLDGTYNNLAKRFIMVGGKPQELMDHEYTSKYKLHKLRQTQQDEQPQTIKNVPTQRLLDKLTGG